jgi:hypothetical protein
MRLAFFVVDVVAGGLGPKRGTSGNKENFDKMLEKKVLTPGMCARLEVTFMTTT